MFDYGYDRCALSWESLIKVHGFYYGKFSSDWLNNTLFLGVIDQWLRWVT